MANLPSNFFHRPLADQITLVDRSKVNDICRVVNFINHCQARRDMEAAIRDLDAIQKTKLETLLTLYNLSQEKNVTLGSASIAPTVERKFEALEALLDVVIRGESNGILICGGPGIGKSYTVEESLRRHRAQYASLKGYSANLEFYQFLHANRNKLVFIDDADSVFGDLITLNILKAILETRPNRQVSWLTTSNQQTAPPSFTFTGKVIFVTNLTVERMNQHMQALMSRILFVNFDVTRPELLRRIRLIARNSDYKRMPRDERMMIARFVIDNELQVKDLSLRTLIHSYDLYLHDPLQWRRNLRFMWQARR